MAQTLLSPLRTGMQHKSRTRMAFAVLSRPFRKPCGSLCAGMKQHSMCATSAVLKLRNVRSAAYECRTL